MRSEVSAFLDALRGEKDLRIAIVGIGNDLNGDDAAGVLVARALRAAQAPYKQPGEPGQPETPVPDLPDFLAAAASAVEPPLPGEDRLLVIDAGPSPESFTGPLRRFGPGLVILIDAAQMGEPPGALRVYDWREAEGLSASTHTMPPSMLAKFLVAELGCRVALIGVQAKDLEFFAPMSGAVQESVVALFQELRKTLARG